MKNESFTVQRPGKEESRPAPRFSPAVGLEPVTHTPNAWNSFWFQPREAWNLHTMRVLFGLLFLGWLLPFWGQQEAFFSLRGWFDHQAYFEIQDSAKFPMGAPAPIGWSVLYLARDNVATLNLFFYATLGVFLLFTLGIAPRITAPLTWVLVVSYIANPATSYDADYLLGIFAFYLMIGYLLVGQWCGNLTLVERILGPWSSLGFGRTNVASYTANFILRAMQIHFLIIVLTSALHKTQFGVWWSGVAFWFGLYTPYGTTMADLVKAQRYSGILLTVLSIAQYLTMAWQIGLPFFAYRKGWPWRTLLIGGGILGWIGSVAIFQQPLFGPISLLGCLTFLTPEEWTGIRNWTLGWFGRGGKKLAAA